MSQSGESAPTRPEQPPDTLEPRASLKAPSLWSLDGAATDDLVERVARRVVELLRDEPATATSEWVDARRVAEEFGVSRDFVYAHADELGAVPISACGDGRRPRLRFDLSTVAAALTARRMSERPQLAEVPANQPVSSRRRSRAAGSDVELLPIRGRSEAA